MEKLALERELSKYIGSKHTHEECIGFIAGFEKAVELSNEPELLEALQAMASRFKNTDSRMIKATYVKHKVQQAIDKSLNG